MKIFSRRNNDLSELKGWPGRLREAMSRFDLPSRLLFFILGIASTVWFLIRVIPKPSRAAYPCMKVAAPFMSGLVIYLLSMGGITLVSRRLKRRIINTRYYSALLLLFGMVTVMAINPASNSLAGNNESEIRTGPDDGPNQPREGCLGMGYNRHKKELHRILFQS